MKKDIYDLFNDIDNSNLINEFENEKDEELLDGEKIYKHIVDKKKRKNHFLKIASIALISIVSIFGASYAYGGDLFEKIPFINLPFEKKDYNSFKEYVYIPEKNSVEIDNCKFSVLGVILDDDTIHVSSLLKNNDNKKTPEYEVELLINGKVLKTLSGSYTNPELPISNSSVDFSTKGVDMDKKNNIKVKIRLLDSDKSVSLDFNAKMKNLRAVSKIVNINKSYSENGITINMKKIYANPFMTRVELEYIVDNYSYYKKMYEQSKNKIVLNNKNDYVIFINKNATFILGNERLNYNLIEDTAYVKDNKYIEKVFINFSSKGETYDYKQLISSKLYENIFDSELELDYKVELYSYIYNKKHDKILKTVKGNKKPIIFDIKK